MGFLNIADKAKRVNLGGLSLPTLHRLQCKVCPLSSQGHNIPAYGADKPWVYMLGEAPGEMEVRKRKPFVGQSGQALNLRIAPEFQDRLRWNNVIRSRPPGNRDPDAIEIECCRPSVAGDIERSKPKAIFGFGNVPLKWATGLSGIKAWRGRYLPVRIGDHVCWYFPMLHPSFVIRERFNGHAPRDAQDFPSEWEFAFSMDLWRAFDLVDVLPDPIIHDEQRALAGIEWIDGSKAGDLERVEEWYKHFAPQPYIGYDYETNALQPFNDDARILSVGLSDGEHSVAWPFGHPQAGWSDDQLEYLVAMHKEWLLDAPCIKVVHNLPFELKWSAVFFGHETCQTGTWQCTQSQAYVLDERKDKGMQALDGLTRMNFGFHIKKLSKVDRTNLINTPIADALRYNALDSKYHLLLFLAQCEKLEREGLLEVQAAHLRRSIAAPLVQVQGVPILPEVVEKLYAEIDGKRSKALAEIRALPSVTIWEKAHRSEWRPSAGQDLHSLLNDAGLDPEKVNKETLNGLKHEIVKPLLAWREQDKLAGTYLEGIREGSPLIYQDGLLHPELSVTSVDTTRTSSFDPNIQNYPSRAHRELRSVVGERGYKVVSIDYASIQARNIAMESLDTALVRAFWDDYDIHKDWMGRVAAKHPRWVTEGAHLIGKDPAVSKKYRSLVKNNFVFASFFGAKEGRISRELHCEPELARELQADFWAEFPDIFTWHQMLKDFYYEHGYVAGLSGFRRRAPISPNQLINAPIQADEALIVCDAMAALCQLEDPALHPSMEIHDDLTFIWPERDIDRNLEIVLPIMLAINYDWINVPLEVEVSVGDDWASVSGKTVYASHKMGLGPEMPAWLAKEKAKAG